MQLSTIDKQQTMTSREIAELTGKRHDHMMRDIRNVSKQLKEAGEDVSGFIEANEKDKQNPVSLRTWIKTMQSEEGLSWNQRQAFQWLDDKYTFKTEGGERQFYAKYREFFTLEPVVISTRSGNKQRHQLKITGQGQIILGDKMLADAVKGGCND